MSNFKQVLLACFDTMLKWKSLLLLLNWVFFGFIFIGFLLGSAAIVGPYKFFFGEIVPTMNNYAFLPTFVQLFLFNLAIGSFLYLVCTGILFFGLPMGFLAFKAMLWGALMSFLPTSRLLVILPTVFLEGEGYVLSGLIGIVLGLSWLEPDWVFKEERMSRLQALRQGLRNSAYIYLIAIVVLFIAAITYAVTSIYQ